MLCYSESGETLSEEPLPVEVQNTAAVPPVQVKEEKPEDSLQEEDSNVNLAKVLNLVFHSDLSMFQR